MELQAFAVPVAVPVPARRPRGRPPGSKNKKRQAAVAPTPPDDVADVEFVPSVSTLLPLHGREPSQRMAARRSAQQTEAMLRSEFQEAVQEQLRGTKPDVRMRKHSCSVCLDELAPGDFYLSLCAHQPSLRMCSTCAATAHAMLCAESADTPSLAVGWCLHHMRTGCAAYHGRALIAEFSVCFDVEKLLFATRCREHTLFRRRRIGAVQVTCPGCYAAASVTRDWVDHHAEHERDSSVVMCRTCSAHVICVKCLDVWDARDVAATEVIDGGLVISAADPFVEVAFDDASFHVCAKHALPSVPQAVTDLFLKSHTCGGATHRNKHIPTPRPATFSPVVLTAPCETFFAWALALHVDTLTPIFDAHYNMADNEIVSWSVNSAMVYRRLNAAPDADLMDVVLPVLDALYDVGIRQVCPRCGYTGVKDDKCTHMSCCHSWCYVCEGELLTGSGPTRCARNCPLLLERATLAATDAQSHVTQDEANDLFHKAKLCVLGSFWLRLCGLTRGVYSLMKHPYWEGVWHEFGARMFIGPANAAVLSAIRGSDAAFAAELGL